jgi:hypothetical protein
MKRNEIIVHEHKKGVRAVKYNQKPQSHIEPPAPRNPVAKNASAAIGGGAAGAHKDKKKAAKSGETKHKGQMDIAEGVEDRISYQVAKVLHDNGITYDPAREDELINVIGMALVKKLDMSPKEARAVMNDEDFLGDTMGELRHMEQSVADGPPKDLNAPKMVQDRKTGKLYDPNKEFAKKMNSPEVMAQMKRMAQKEGTAEGYRDRRDAYQRDYDSSVSGMGRRQSRAYQDDGGANDERHDLDPTDWYFVKDGKMFAVSVYPNQEREAMSRGYSRTRIEARAKANDQDKTEAMGAEVGKITKVDPATKKATLTKADGSSMEVDSTALKPTPDGKMSMDTPDTDELKAGTAVVSTEDMMAPPNDSSSPIPGDNNHDEISKLLVHRLKRLAGL